MPDRYKKILMWALYAALMLAAALLQTVVFGRVRYFGAKLSLLPVALACVCMHTEPEPAGLFGLLTGLGWYACGADGAGLSILTFTAVALGVSWLCRQYLRAQLPAALILSAAALLFTQGALALIRLYLGTPGETSLRILFVGCGLSLIACPLLYLLASRISRIYRPQKI